MESLPFCVFVLFHSSVSWKDELFGYNPRPYLVFGFLLDLTNGEVEDQQGMGGREEIAVEHALPAQVCVPTA